MYRNLVRNTEAAGAAAGTPGTPPRRWALVDDPPMAGNGLSSQVVGVAQESGLRRLDWRFQGSAGGEGNLAICVEGLVRVEPGQYVTHSCFVRFTALPNGDLLPLYAIQINEYDADGQFLAANQAAFTPQLAALRPQRQAITEVRASAATRWVRPILGLYYAPGQIFDFTLGIAHPQLELGTRVTAPERRLAL